MLKFSIKFIPGYLEEMAEWFKAADCKSVELFHRRFKSYSLHKRFKNNLQ